MASYLWCIEASAEGGNRSFTELLRLGAEVLPAKPLLREPYSFSNGAEECYALSAFHHRVIASGYDPLGYIALKLLEKWSEEGTPGTSLLHAGYWTTSPGYISRPH